MDPNELRWRNTGIAVRQLNRVINLAPPDVANGPDKAATGLPSHWANSLQGAWEVFKTASNVFAERKPPMTQLPKLKSGLQSIGPAGQNVLSAFLPRNGGLPETDGWTQWQKFALYSLYVVCSGTGPAILDLLVGRRVILGLRVETSTKANKGLGEYDDRFVIVWIDTGGRGRALEFPGNTEPAYAYDAKNPSKRKAMGQDVDGDGVKDLGRVPVGTYPFHKDSSDTYGRVLRPSQPIALERDSNHDGAFNAADVVKASLAKNRYASDTLFHKGGRGGFTGSAGCQTLETHVFDAFYNELGPQQKFHYVLTKVG